MNTMKLPAERMLTERKTATSKSWNCCSKPADDLCYKCEIIKYCSRLFFQSKIMV